MLIVKLSVVGWKMNERFESGNNKVNVSIIGESKRKGQWLRRAGRTGRVHFP